MAGARAGCPRARPSGPPRRGRPKLQLSRALFAPVVRETPAAFSVASLPESIIAMGAQNESFKRYVEVGRVVLLHGGANDRKLAVIVDIIDPNRVSHPAADAMGTV